jgi:hypothetical protein
MLSEREVVPPGRQIVPDNVLIVRNRNESRHGDFFRSSPRRGRRLPSGQPTSPQNSSFLLRCESELEDFRLTGAGCPLAPSAEPRNDTP